MPAGSRRGALLWSLAALSCGLVLSTLAARFHQARLADEQEQRTERLVERSVEAIQGQLRACGQLVRAVQTLFLGSATVDLSEFEHVYANLSPRTVFPSMLAFAYAPRSDVPGTPGAVRYAYTMVAPLAGNEHLLGLNIGTQRANMQALELSRDSDEPVLSAPFRLIQPDPRNDDIDGVTIRLPVFSPGPPPRTVAERRQRIVGSLAVSFRMWRLIETALPKETLAMLDVRVSDVTDAVPQLLFDAQAGAMRPADDAAVAIIRDLHYGGRVWRVSMLPRADVGMAGQLLPWLTFGIGLLASVLFALLAWSLTRTHARALRLADAMSAQYRDSEARFRVLSDLLPALVLLARCSDRAVVYANAAGRARLGLAGDGVPASPLERLFVDHGLGARIEQVGRGGAMLSNLQTRMRAADGTGFWATLSLSRIDVDGQPHLLTVASDSTELRELTEQLRHQASHDTLTDLYNRREFGHRLDAAIARAGSGGPHAALIYLDLDQFKLINDTSGHYAGDQLLAHLADVLRGCIGEHDILARLGGDEFGLLLTDTDRDDALAVAERIRIRIDGFVFPWEHKVYSVSASLGVVMIDRPGLNQRESLSLADSACYIAKERGRNRVHLFAENDLAASQRRSEMEWVNRLQLALSDQRFYLEYQQLAALQPDHESGVHIEVLLRLRDEDGHSVPPGAFIPAAERYGLMPQIDRWVVDTALRNFDRLHPAGAALALCAINLSATTADDDHFIDFLGDALRRTGVPPHKVCLEITETAAVSNLARMVRFIEQLRATGCRVALDDFGAGMSSFGYLKNLPVDYVKIDGSFIRDMETDPMSHSIVRAVTDIGHQIGLQVIAEWVTSERTCTLLREIGVDYAQGFVVHRPQPAVYVDAPLVSAGATE